MTYDTKSKQAAKLRETWEDPVSNSDNSVIISSLSGLDQKLTIFPGGSDGKESAGNLGDLGLIPGLGRSSGEGNGNPLQNSCLENPMDREALWATTTGSQRVRHN